MASEGVLISGVSDFDSALMRDAAKTDAASRSIVVRGSEIIDRHAKELWRPRPSGSQRTSKKSGRTYYDGSPPYQAVRPYPTLRTGNTRDSIGMHVGPKQLGPGRWMSGTGPTTPYAPYLEFGTSHINPPFAFMGPGVKKSELEIQSLAQEEWAKAQE